MINFQYLFNIVIVTFQQALTVLKIDYKGKIKIKTKVNKSWILLWSLKLFQSNFLLILYWPFLVFWVLRSYSPDQSVKVLSKSERHFIDQSSCTTFCSIFLGWDWWSRTQQMAFGKRPRCARVSMPTIKQRCVEQWSSSKCYQREFCSLAGGIPFCSIFWWKGAHIWIFLKSMNVSHYKVWGLLSQ